MTLKQLFFFLILSNPNTEFSLDCPKAISACYSVKIKLTTVVMVYDMVFLLITIPSRFKICIVETNFRLNKILQEFVQKTFLYIYISQSHYPFSEVAFWYYITVYINCAGHPMLVLNNIRPVIRRWQGIMMEESVRQLKRGRKDIL